MNKKLRVFAVTAVSVTALIGCKTADHDSDKTTTTSTTVPGLEQPAVWPAANVRFATPEEAAQDFVTKVLHVDTNIGEFQPGDSLSGEIDVYSPESNVVRGTLLMRKLGPDQSWVVIGAISSVNTILEPAHQGMVSAGSITVSGKGRGFEAQLHVTAIDPTNPSTPIAEQFPMGGSAEEALPFSTQIDLTNVKTGATITIVLQGGVGLENDPGEFSAIVVTVG